MTQSVPATFHCPALGVAVRAAAKVTAAVGDGAGAYRRGGAVWRALGIPEETPKGTPEEIPAGGDGRRGCCCGGGIRAWARRRVRRAHGPLTPTTPQWCEMR